MRFIEITIVQDTKVYVNVARILFMYRDNDATPFTMLHLTDDETIRVKETPDEILAKI